MQRRHRIQSRGASDPVLTAAKRTTRSFILPGVSPLDPLGRLVIDAPNRNEAISSFEGQDAVRVKPELLVCML